MNTTGDVVHQRREAAADWCVRLGDGLALEEQAMFEAWLASDPLNRAEFERLAGLWRDASAAADSPELIGVRADALAAFRAANQERWSIRLAPRRRALTAIVAGLALIIAAAFFFLHDRAVVYATAVGERRLVKLEDGSRISLDADTSVEVAYGGERRALRLMAGRAKFDVAKDPRRPFTVAAGDRMVVATGTSFSVELVQQQMRVVLYEGNVAVLEDTPRNKPPRHIELRALRAAADQALKPGTVMVAALDSPVASVEPIDTARSLSWEGGQLTFDDEPLALAAERVNRYSDLKIEVVGAAARIPVSGAFNTGDTEGFVEGIRALYPLAMERNDSTITLSENSSQH